MRALGRSLRPWKRSLDIALLTPSPVAFVTSVLVMLLMIFLSVIMLFQDRRGQGGRCNASCLGN